MSGIECPYCEHEQEVCDHYEEDETHKMECRSCEKTFIFTTEIIFCYSPSKADCLNEGGEHRWTPTNIMLRQYTDMRCRDCGELRSLTADEVQEIVEMNYE